MHERQREQRQRQTRRLHTHAGGEAGHDSANHQCPRVCPAGEEQRLRHERRGEPWHVAHGTRSRHPEQRRRREERRGPDRGDGSDRRKDRVGGQQRDRAAKRGPDRERQAFESNAVERRGHDPQEPLRSPAERDVDRISRRVRLMTGDVEVAQPEREIDRIDVFERGCEIREVEREIENGDRDDRPRNGRLRRHGGEHLRSGCPSDNPADR